MCQHDVVVLGAGPAGTSAAIRLAELGFDVGVVERVPFPRGHVGICISDQTVSLVNALGVAQAFRDAGFCRRFVTAVHWGNDRPRLVPLQGYHVDRAAFDSLMLNRAQSVGAKMYQPANILRIDRPNDSMWGLLLSTEAGLQQISSKFLIDATGRRSAIRSVRVKDSPPLVCIHAMWIPTSEMGFEGYIEAGKNAWLWYAKNGSSSAIVSIFCDPRSLKSTRGGNLQVKYDQLLASFRFRRFLVEQVSAPRACDASSHHTADPVSDTHIRLGDSCFCIDPMSSQGVHLALQSGMQGAIVVNTVLKKPEQKEVAQRFFRARVASQIARHSERTSQEYGRVSAISTDRFWLERSTDKAIEQKNAPKIARLSSARSNKVAVSTEVTFDIEPVIDGNFVELRPTIRHPDLDGSIRYLGDVDLTTLLTVLPPSFNYDELPDLWQTQIPPTASKLIAAWFWERRVLVPIAAVPVSEPETRSNHVSISATTRR